MLQQTQGSRVEGKYREFLKAFPNVRVLASAPLADLLRVWSGLGYNRRAKFLHDAAKVIVTKHKGKVPTACSELVELPGIGDYTAKAVRVFAFNDPEVLIETNIRTAFIHYFASGRAGSALRSFSEAELIHDNQILPIVLRAAERQDSRKWHWALIDYGAHLKASGVRLNTRSAHYTKQPKFEGSLRQIRGAILRELYSDGHKDKGKNAMRRRLIAFSKERFEKALASLVREGLVEK